MRLLLYVLAVKVGVIVCGAVIALSAMVGVRIAIDLTEIALAVASTALRML